MEKRQSIKEERSGNDHGHGEPAAHSHKSRVASREHDSEPAELGLRMASGLSKHVNRDPYGTLGIALGLGLLVGGGMWRLVARAVVGLGTRVAMGAMADMLVERKALHPHTEH